MIFSRTIGCCSFKSIITRFIRKCAAVAGQQMRERGADWTGRASRPQATWTQIHTCEHRSSHIFRWEHRMHQTVAGKTRKMVKKEERGKHVRDKLHPNSHQNRKKEDKEGQKGTTCHAVRKPGRTVKVITNGESSMEKIRKGSRTSPPALFIKLMVDVLSEIRYKVVHVMYCHHVPWDPFPKVQQYLCGFAILVRIVPNLIWVLPCTVTAPRPN